MRSVLTIVALAVTSAACFTADESLPFYSDRTFSPAWAATDHSIIVAGDAETFVDQSGASFALSSLRGRVHVASFIFTRCAAICPPLVSSMKRVQAAAAGTDVILLSYTVTPDLDTADVLRDFGRERGVDPSRWKLLTGNPGGIIRVARDRYFADDDGMRALLSKPDAFLHTEKLLLVDRDGRIRGVYNGTQPFEVQKLVDDLRVLVPAIAAASR
jgi:protein SCO1/2